MVWLLPVPASPHSIAKPFAPVRCAKASACSGFSVWAAAVAAIRSVLKPCESSSARVLRVALQRHFRGQNLAGRVARHRPFARCSRKPMTFSCGENLGAGTSPAPRLSGMP